MHIGFNQRFLKQREALEALRHMGFKSWIQYRQSRAKIQQSIRRKSLIPERLIMVDEEKIDAPRQLNLRNFLRVQVKSLLRSDFFSALCL